MVVGKRSCLELSLVLVNNSRGKRVLVRVDPDEMQREASRQQVGSPGVEQTCVCPSRPLL
jgi:hypothetical protein